MDQYFEVCKLSKGSGMVILTSYSHSMFSISLYAFIYLISIYSFSYVRTLIVGPLWYLPRMLGKLLSLMITFDKNHPVHSSILLNDEAYW